MTPSRQSRFKILVFGLLHRLWYSLETRRSFCLPPDIQPFPSSPNRPPSTFEYFNRAKLPPQPLWHQKLRQYPAIEL